MAKRKSKFFEGMKQALEDMAAYERGEPINLRVTELPPPPKPLRPEEIRAIRVSLKASQALFARYLNVSANTVESWEQGVRRPQDATLKLLRIAKKRPQVLLEA
ncbi:MAG: helix-turn-helix domain-containing protein [Candidatus Acidiferrales bacterium]